MALRSPGGSSTQFNSGDPPEGDSQLSTSHPAYISSPHCGNGLISVNKTFLYFGGSQGSETALRQPLPCVLHRDNQYQRCSPGGIGGLPRKPSLGGPVGPGSSPLHPHSRQHNPLPPAPCCPGTLVVSLISHPFSSTPLYKPLWVGFLHGKESWTRDLGSADLSACCSTNLPCDLGRVTILSELSFPSVAGLASLTTEPVLGWG